MQGKDKNQAPMIQVINIEALVPQNYILRYVDQAVDFSFIRERTKSLYTEGLGRYSIPPELVLRAFLLQYLFNLSDRMLCNEMAMHAGFRWFCRLNFDDPIPERTTLVKLRRLWAKTGVFEDVMRHVVQQCVRAGLVSGKALGVDGTQVTANAAINSLTAIAPVVSLDQWLQGQAAEDAKTENENDQNSGGGTAAPSPAERQAGDPNFRGEKFSNQTHRSKTDPDARLYRKGRGQEAKLRYLVHNTVDLRSGVILATGASRPYGTAEREMGIALLDEALWHLPPEQWMRRLIQYIADARYAAGWFLAEVFARGVRPVVPMATTAPEPIPTWQRRASTLEQPRSRKQKVREAEARNAVRAPPG